MSEIKTLSANAVDLTDESFDAKKTASCHLSISVGPKELAFSILDTASNKYVALHYERTGIPLPASLAKLNSGFKSVTCALAHPKFSLVPTALFDDENKQSLLGFNHPVETTEKIHSDLLQNLDARNLYAISRDIEDQFRKQFPAVHFIHNATCFIEGLLVRNKNKTGKKVFADFHSSYFEIVILKGSELLFSNAFSYKTAEDIAYYILFVYEQLHLNPEEIELVLSGEIEKTAKEHELLYTYIRHVKFSVLPDSFAYSYKFDEVQPHRFFSLLNQYQCV